MMDKQIVTCKCGHVKLQVDGSHIASVECLCDSCRKAGKTLSSLPGAGDILDGKGATRMVMHRKDRVQFLSGKELLREYRLSPEAATRRVVATCCNTAVFLDVKGGHWFSLYARLWPEGTLPPLELRTMVGDLDDPSVVPEDVPNLKTHSLGFYWRLVSAWACMGFRTPKVIVEGVLDV